MHNAPEPAMQQSIGLSAVTPPRTVVARVWRNLCAHDWVLIVYFALLLFLVLNGSGPLKALSLKLVLVDTAVLWTGLILTRGELVRGLFASVIYRFSIFTPPVVSYFQLRHILPTVTTRALDAQIYAFDMKIFHYEPAIAWDQFVNPQTTEWFAFFYFGYFFIMAGHFFPFLLLIDDTPVYRHFAFGIFVQFIVSHILYMVVPGFGPYHEFTFAHQLQGGTFWHLVLGAVANGGALKDIFPSLHTGAPLYVLLFSFVYRKKFPFKYTWIPLAFAVSQIIIATMFLRWHYLIDIIAGISLSIFAVTIGGKVARWEAGYREKRLATPIFGPAPIPWLWRRIFAKTER